MSFAASAEARSQSSVHTSQPYYGYFDMLRAVLAFFVFVSHANVLPERLEPLGAYAVVIFFSLSGYLVGGILLDMRTKENYWSKLPKFYFNRCLRIWIPYYLLIASYIALMLLRGMWSYELEARLVPLLTYTHNWANDVWGISQTVGSINHAWSLAVEEQFYLVCPLLIGLLALRLPTMAVMLFMAIALPIFFGVTYFTAICFGVAAAVGKRELSGDIWRTIQWLALPLGIVGAISLLLMGFERGHIGVAVCCICVVVGLSKERAKHSVVYLLGAMSYSFYLFHWMGLYIANPIGKRLPESVSTVAVFVIALLIATAISYGSVKIVEWPLMKRRELIASRYPNLVKALSVLAFIVTLTGLLHLALSSNPAAL